MNDQRRQAAIEATKAALQREFGGFLAHDPHNPERFWTMTAAAVIDAALPHLQPQPAGHATYSTLTGRLSIDLSVRTTQVSVRYALIPVDEP